MRTISGADFGLKRAARQRVNPRDDARQEFCIEALGGGEVHGRCGDLV
jgi:hypothetical protein